MNTEPAQPRFEARDGDVLAVCGSLVFATATQAWQDGKAVLHKHRPATLDLAGVEHSDSAGLACVLALLARGREVNNQLRVVNAPDSMRALARVSDAQAWLDDQAGS